MTGRTVRGIAAIVVVLAGLTGCARGSVDGPGGDGCMPLWPRLSEDVVRPGDTVTISVSAATCTPTFVDGGRLEVLWQDHAGRRARLATVHAFPSGAFEQRIRIPSTAALGGGDVFVSGLDIPCPGSASCAAYETWAEVVRDSPDFGRSALANGVAAEVAARMRARLHGRVWFVGLAIVPDGLEVRLSDASDAHSAEARRVFAEAVDAVPTGDRETVGAAQLHVETVRYGAAELARVMQRISKDAEWLKAHGIGLTGWGPDPATDSVRVAVRHYRDADAVLLSKRYGPAISVSTVDTPEGIAS